MEFENYCWLTQKGELSKDEPKKEDDHSMDAIRYTLYTRERGRARVIQNNPFRRK
jgi:hypothetical protein